LQELAELLELVLGHCRIERVAVDRLGQQLGHPRLEAVDHLPAGRTLPPKSQPVAIWLLTNVSIGTLSRLA
jgi:hypothetical protein